MVNTHTILDQVIFESREIGGSFEKHVLESAKKSGVKPHCALAPAFVVAT